MRDVTFVFHPVYFEIEPISIILLLGVILVILILAIFFVRKELRK